MFYTSFNPSVKVSVCWDRIHLACVSLYLSITFTQCAPQKHYFETSTPRYVYWSAIGSSFSPHFPVKVPGFTLSWLHTIQLGTAHLFTFAVTLDFLVYSMWCLLCFCNPSGVFLLFPRNHPPTSIPTLLHPSPP